MSKVEKQIIATIETIRPILGAHGGDLSLIKIDIKQQKVHIRFSGTCESCPISEITVRHVIERTIQKDYPLFRAVVTT